MSNVDSFLLYVWPCVEYIGTKKQENRKSICKILVFKREICTDWGVRGYKVRNGNKVGKSFKKVSIWEEYKV